MIIVKTPLRISFFGGGTDFPAWYKSNKGKVISCSIDKYGYLTIKKLNKISKYNYVIRYHKNEYCYKVSEIRHKVVRAVLKKYNVKSRLEISYSADLPALSGLGSSSAFTVGLIRGMRHFLKKKKLSKYKLLNEALDIEHNILKETCGSQDQTAAAFGGFNIINFEKKKISVINQNKNFNILEKINKYMTLVFSDIQRYAFKIEGEKINTIERRSDHYKSLYDISCRAEKSIKNKKFSVKEFIRLLNENMKIKKNLSKNVTNKKIDKIISMGLKNGASGSKILGAGGGGFILFISKNYNEKKKLEKKLMKFKIVDFKFINKIPKIENIVL